MAEIKCSSCDRRYSSLRGRCPFCGARRRKAGKRVSEPENAKWKLIIGVLLLVIVIAAVVVLLVMSPGGEKEAEITPSPSPEFSESDGVVSAENEPLPEPEPSPEPEPEPEPEPSPVTATESVAITWLGNVREDVTLPTGDSLQFGIKTVPEDSTDTPVWSSDNEQVFVVLQTGKVTAVGKGTATLTVTCGAATGSCIIRVNK